MNRYPFGPVAVDAPAKVNLSLTITGKRPDGYHELVSLMCPLGLSDTIVLRSSSGSLQVTVNGGGGQVPASPDNLAGRAAVAMARKLGIAPSLRIHIEKRIPVAAGLGGGSSDAAAVLRGWNRILGNPLDIEELAGLGLGIGADVPFFVRGGAAWAEGIGEILTPVADLKRYQVVLVNPGVAVSTADVYKNLKWPLTKQAIKTKKTHFEGGFIDPQSILSNDLEPVTSGMHGEIREVREAVAHCGADGVLMSGSGPTVFGLFSDRMRAQNACDQLAENSNWRVILTHLIP